LDLSSLSLPQVWTQGQLILLTCHFPVAHSYGSSHTLEKDKQDHHSPLGVKLTGYRLLNLAVILAIGILKAISSYNGQGVIPTTLDCVSGTLLATV